MKEKSNQIVTVKIVGDIGVGKSCMIDRFVDDRFTDSYVPRGINYGYREKPLQVDGQAVRMQVYNTAGTLESVVGARGYRDVNVFIVAFDVTMRTSFDHVEEWIAHIYRYASENAKIILVGTKVDLPEEEHVVTPKEIQELMRYNDRIVGFHKISVKTGNENVNQVFADAAFAVVGNKPPVHKVAMQRTRQPALKPDKQVTPEAVTDIVRPILESQPPVQYDEMPNISDEPLQQPTNKKDNGVVAEVGSTFSGSKSPIQNDEIIRTFEPSSTPPTALPPSGIRQFFNALSWPFRKSWSGLCWLGRGFLSLLPSSSSNERVRSPLLNSQQDSVADRIGEVTQSIPTILLNAEFENAASMNMSHEPVHSKEANELGSAIKQPALDNDDRYAASARALAGQAKTQLEKQSQADSSPSADSEDPSLSNH